MPKKKRDFAREYARRIESGHARGLTRSQARGHPSAGAPYASQRIVSRKRSKPDKTLEEAIRAIRSGESMSAAAKRLHVARERLSPYAKTQAGAVRSGRTWAFNDSRRRRIPIIAKGSLKPLQIWVSGHEAASLAGQHYGEAVKALEAPELFPALIAKWSGVAVTDTKGREHYFETDPNQLYRALIADEIDWSRIYHLQVN